MLTFDVTRYRKLIIAGLVLIYIGVLLGNAATRIPWVDEMYVGNPAWNLVHQGSLGTSCVEMAGSKWTRVDGITYNTFPLGILNLAAWYKLFGFSLLTTRLPSMLWAGVLLGSIYFLILGLGGGRRLAILSVAVLAVDYNFMIAATFGRVDMMCAALGFSAVGAYCILRDRRPLLAVLTSTALAALSVFTHPNGVLFIAALPVVEIVMFRATIQWRHAVLAPLPLLAATGAWLMFASKDRSAAIGQLSANMSQGRLVAFLHPLNSLRDEVIGRYLVAFGLTLGEHPSGPVRARGLILVAYLGAMVAGLLLPSIRRARWAHVLFSLWLVIGIYFTFFEGTRFTYYIVIVTPIYCIVLSAVLLHLAQWNRMTAVLLFLGLALLQMGGVAYRSFQKQYQNSYLPAVAFLQSRALPSDLVLANCDFGFGYGFDRNVKEEITLGYRSSVKPRYIVIDANIAGIMQGWKSIEPGIYNFMIGRLSTYNEIYNFQSYRIFAAPEILNQSRSLTKPE